MKTILWTYFVLTILSSCSASWHVKKARAKDPSLFETQTIREVTPIEIPPAVFDFDCKQLMMPAKIELYSPTIITNPVTGETKIDTLLVYITTADTTGQVTMVVDCPDAEVIHDTITETVFIKPSNWYNIRLLLIGAVAMFIIMFLRK